MIRKLMLASAVAAVFAAPLASAYAEGDEAKKPEQQLFPIILVEDEKKPETQLIVADSDEKKPEQPQLILADSDEKKPEQPQLILADSDEKKPEQPQLG